jgi:hypothetical protein
MTEEIDVKTVKWNDLTELQLAEKGKTALRNYLLNQTPQKTWIKKHPLYSNDYLPIDKVEFLLTCFFQTWRVEIKQVFQIANSVCVTVRLFYKNPDTGEMDWQDGGGAAPMQVNSKSNPMDSNEIKSNAVMLALPIAETNAVKDAADKIGKIFGRDLNRKDTLGYEVLVKDFSNAKIIEK